MLSLLRAWRTDKSAAQFLSSLCERLPTGARGRVDISTQNPPFAPNVSLIFDVVRCCCYLFIYFLPLWRDTSTTSPLITSACHGNFVRQKRNALFWRDDDPLARPKAQLELECYGCSLKKKKRKEKKHEGTKQK